MTMHSLGQRWMGMLLFAATAACAPETSEEGTSLDADHEAPPSSGDTVQATGEGECPTGTALQMRYLGPEDETYADQFEAVQDGDSLRVVRQDGGDSGLLTIEYRVLNPDDYKERWLAVTRDGQEIYSAYSGSGLAPDPRWPCYGTDAADGFVHAEDGGVSALTSAPVDITIRLLREESGAEVEATVRNVNLVSYEL